MYVYDPEWNLIESPDESAGKLEYKEVTVKHVYIVDIEEQGHFEVIAEYPETGGKDVEWVVDVEKQGHWQTSFEDGVVFANYPAETIPDDWPKEQETTDVFEYFLYTPYTAEELEQIAIEKAEAERQRQIAELKRKLTETDYIITKMSEYNVSGVEMPAEDAERYAAIIEQRQQWRDQINELEAQNES